MHTLSSLASRLRGRVQSRARSLGVDISRVKSFSDYPGTTEVEREALSVAEGRTMASANRVLNFMESCRYAAERESSSAIVECGVWRGGMVMAAATYLQSLGLPLPPLYLFDTFDGMTAPTVEDQTLAGSRSAQELSWNAKSSDGSALAGVAAFATLDDVKQGMEATRYPSNLVHYVVGPVERTLPVEAPNQISVLRLDTDWYGSTRHELIHLWPRLRHGGVLILDDYDYWAGARLAVDEFLQQEGLEIPLIRMDEGRIAIKF